MRTYATILLRLRHAVLATAASLQRCWMFAGICVLMSTVSADAAQPYTPSQADPLLEPWRWRKFDELAGIGLRCMARGQDGTMWFGTDMGVHSYDGTTWRLFTEDDGQLRPPVNALLATRDGQVYAGTEMGVFGYRDGGWHRVFPEGDFPWPTVGLTEGQGGAIWAITAMGALRLSGRDVLLYTSPDQAAALAVIAPTCPTVIVPERILSRYIWEPGIGVRLFSNPRVGWRTEFGPWLIEGIALHSPAEAAGLAVGDLMLEVDGIQPAAPELSMSGPPGRPLTLTVLQPGQKEPVLVDVTRADFGEKLWYWFGSPRYRSKHSIGIDSTASVSGSRSAYIGSVSTDDEVASSLLRVLDPEKYGGRKLSVSARLRLQDVAKAVTVGADVQ